MDQIRESVTMEQPFDKELGKNLGVRKLLISQA